MVRKIDIRFTHREIRHLAKSNYLEPTIPKRDLPGILIVLQT